MKWLDEEKFSSIERILVEFAAVAGIRADASAKENQERLEAFYRQRPPSAELVAGVEELLRMEQGERLRASNRAMGLESRSSVSTTSTSATVRGGPMARFLIGEIQ